jgi:hypothetical protein
VDLEVQEENNLEFLRNHNLFCFSMNRVDIKEIIKNEVISEGLVKTYSKETVYDYLNSIGLIFNEDYSLVEREDQYSMVLLTKKGNNIKKDYFEILNKLQNLYGWIHGSTDLVTKFGTRLLKNRKEFLVDNNINNQYLLYFEPKFDMGYNPINNTPYHLTFKFNYDKIIKNGLTPKSNDDYFSYGNQSRIYFFTEINDNKISEFIKNLYRSKKKNNGDSDLRYFTKFVLLEISTSDLNIDFFKDINLDGGVYCTGNIPPNKIKLIRNYEINPTNYNIKTY